MKRTTKTAQRLALVAVGLAAAALTVGVSANFDNQGHSKSDTVSRMMEIAEQVQELRASGSRTSMIERLTREYTRLSTTLGGDDPAHLLGGGVPGRPAPVGPTGGIASAPPAPPGCTSASTTFTNTTPQAIGIAPAPTVPVISSTITVAGASTFLWDLNVTTSITHPSAGDLDMTVMSPAGTVVTLSTDNGGVNSFSGTLWDDDADPDGQVPYANNNALATDHAYAFNVAASPLAPEEALGAFIGENPNGVWTLTISDDLANGSNGTLNSWSLDVTAAAAGPATTLTNVSSTDVPKTITTAAPPQVVTSTTAVSGLGTVLTDVNVTTSITHTFASDLDITIMSPAGTIVTLSTDNGSVFDNVFNGTLWDDDADPDGQVPYTSNEGLVGDATYADLVVETPLAPEEALAAFIGENPNGTWTLTISDDATGDGGTLSAWSLALTTTTAAPATGLTSASNATSQAFDIQALILVTSTISVSGVDPYLWDLDVATTIDHVNSSDLDVTLQSPAGTVVTLTSDNGLALDNVFNGTSWDDDADPDGQVPYTANNGMVGDHTYVNLTVATPLTPEEALGAFIGEDPNGVWTLTINDDAPGSSGGNLSSWSMTVTALEAAPADDLVTGSNTTPVLIPDSGGPLATSTITISGADPYLCDVNVTMDLEHTFNSDLDFTLTSPAGTIVTISSDNGSFNDNVFAGTTFDDDADPDGQVPHFVNLNENSVTDHFYEDLTVATPLTPEEPLAAFIGEDPNGVWTLRIDDDLGGDVGTLQSWSIDITTCACTGCAADINGDNVTDVNDLLLLVGSFGATGANAADLNGDLVVDVNDLLILVGDYNCGLP